MTNSQKSKISELRQSGNSYTIIAERLNISINSVKSYCRRNSLKTIDNNTCKVCGNKITQIQGRKKRVFCSDNCRVQWWNSHPEEVKQKAVYNFTCSKCGKKFTAYGNAKRKYCSHECYIKARFGK